MVVSSMDLMERPRNQRPTDPPTTTPKPEVTTEDTSDRILSLPIEEKCMRSKFKTIIYAMNKIIRILLKYKLITVLQIVKSQT